MCVCTFTRNGPQRLARVVLGSSRLELRCRFARAAVRIPVGQGGGSEALVTALARHLTGKVRRDAKSTETPHTCRTPPRCLPRPMRASGAGLQDPALSDVLQLEEVVAPSFAPGPGIRKKDARPVWPPTTRAETLKTPACRSAIAPRISCAPATRMPKTFKLALRRRRHSAPSPHTHTHQCIAHNGGCPKGERKSWTHTHTRIAPEESPMALELHLAA